MERLRAALGSRPARRLLFAILALAAIDRVEPAILQSLERARYEDPGRDFRFENSDLFDLGPLVDYLREHPRGARRRVVFLGDSVTYGYTLSAAEALPARYQRLDGSAKVFNVGLNGFRPGSLFLIAKATVDCVDEVYALRVPHGTPNVQPLLSSLIPIDEDDRARFQLARPDERERRLSQFADHWRLYRDAYRLQAAMLGSSTRQYLYLHKGAFVRALVARVRAEAAPEPLPGATLTIDAPMSHAMPDAARQRRLRQEDPDLWESADLFLNRRRRIVFLHLSNHSPDMTGADIADFNRVFAPYARVLVVQVPPALTFDSTHLTADGSEALARALWRTRTEEGAP